MSEKTHAKKVLQMKDWTINGLRGMQVFHHSLLVSLHKDVCEGAAYVCSGKLVGKRDWKTI